MGSETFERYREFVPPNIGGTARDINLRQAINICHDVTDERIYQEGIKLLDTEPGIFVVMANMDRQIKMHKRFEGQFPTHSITIRDPIYLDSTTPSNIRVVITTSNKSEGYTLTKFRVMLTSVYLGNQAKSTQIEGRIDRLSQTEREIFIYTFHTGVLSYILANYQMAESFEKALALISKM